MKRPTTERLRDIIEMAEIADSIRPVSRKELDADVKSQLALTRIVEIIGEAANHVSLDVQRAHPEVPWRQIIATRNRITHGYFDVDLNALWEIITADLPMVLPHIRAILGALEGEGPRA